MLQNIPFVIASVAWQSHYAIPLCKVYYPNNEIASFLAMTKFAEKGALRSKLQYKR